MQLSPLFNLLHDIKLKYKSSTFLAFENSYFIQISDLALNHNWILNEKSWKQNLKYLSITGTKLH